MEEDTNQISPHAFVDPSVIMGSGNIVMEGAIIRKGVIMGDNNYFGPYCIIGEVPEKKGYFENYGQVEIGNGNRFEKQVTVDSGTERPTIIRNNVIMLKNAHVGHDAYIADEVVLSCNSLIGGHCKIGFRTNFGLGAAIHQRLNMPEYCMVGINSTITKKTPLFPGRKYAGSPARDIGSNTINIPHAHSDGAKVRGDVGDPNAYC